MKQAIITMDVYGKVAVPSDATNIWMNEMELVELFGATAPALRAAIRAVYKSGVLQRHEAERYIRFPDGYSMDVYSLPMVVALAFRINTPCSARVRDALLERLYGRKERQVLWVSMNRPMCEC